MTTYSTVNLAWGWLYAEGLYDQIHAITILYWVLYYSIITSGKIDKYIGANQRTHVWFLQLIAPLKEV